MTEPSIAERIENIARRLEWADSRIATMTEQSDRKDKDFKASAESELTALLEQVQREQREIIWGKIMLESQEPIGRGRLEKIIRNAPPAWRKS